jgi:hypothetical protein
MIHLYVLLKNNEVIKMKVNENDRKATKSILTMDYAKSTDCILWIHPWHNERQWSVNDFWLCILDNVVGERLRIAINGLLAAFIGKTNSETLPAPS